MSTNKNKLRFVETSRDPFSEGGGEGDGGACPIVLVQQFYLDPKSQERQDEVRFCLLKNLTNSSVAHIYLLNEREFSATELLGNSPSSSSSSSSLHLLLENKVTQRNIGQRLSFRHVFDLANDLTTRTTYMAFANADIYFDATGLARVRAESDIHRARKLFALARTETGQNARLFASTDGVFPRFDSQDAWIMHSRFMLPPHVSAFERATVLDFPLGVPGCDNKFLYVMTRLLQFEAYNCPLAVRAFHCHRSTQRNYSHSPIPFPYAFCLPHGVPAALLAPSFGVDPVQTHPSLDEDSRRLFEYMDHKLSIGEAFVVPRLLDGDGLSWYPADDQAIRASVLAGGGGNNNNNRLTDDALRVAVRAVFQSSELVLGQDLRLVGGGGGGSRGGDIPRGLMRAGKTVVSESVLELYHVHHALLRDRRLLIVTSGEATRALVERQWTRLRAVFEKEGGGEKEEENLLDFFPDCVAEVVAIPPSPAPKPPSASSSEKEEPEEPPDNMLWLDAAAARWDYDVALVALGDHAVSHLVCAHVFVRHGKSAVNVGEALLASLGISSANFAADRPDVARMHALENDAQWLVVEQIE